MRSQLLTACAHVQACLCNRCGSELSRKKKERPAEPAGARAPASLPVAGKASEQPATRQAVLSVLLPVDPPSQSKSGAAAVATGTSGVPASAAVEGQGMPVLPAPQPAVEERRCTHCGLEDTRMWRRWKAGEGAVVRPLACRTPHNTLVCPAQLLCHLPSLPPAGTPPLAGSCVTSAAATCASTRACCRSPTRLRLASLECPVAVLFPWTAWVSQCGQQSCWLGHSDRQGAQQQSTGASSSRHSTEAGPGTGQRLSYDACHSITCCGWECTQQ